MSGAKEYREFAEECLRWAATAHNKEHRQHLLEMAKTWDQAALEAERSQRARPPSNRSETKSSGEQRFGSEIGNS